MYWLIFFNGFDKPVTECAFCTPYMLTDYVKSPVFVLPERQCLYWVATPDNELISLKDFLAKAKEMF